MTPDDPALADGFYISPTIMDNVTDDMVISREEVFGPVATIMTFDTEEEAVKRANNTSAGSGMRHVYKVSECCIK